MTPDGSDDRDTLNPDDRDSRDELDGFDGATTLDPDELDAALAGAFAGAAGERRAVVREALDLRDDGRYREDTGRALSPDAVVEHLGDAPRGTVADRWNWWMGALDVAYDGYREFEVRRYRE